MDGVTLKSRAIAFAVCAGAVAFILAVAAVSPRGGAAENAGWALIAAILCGTMCWAAVERSLSSTAGAIDSAIARLTRAADGDLESEIPEEVTQWVPQLAAAMDGLFRQLHQNLEGVQRLARFDTVTELPNRAHFRTEAEQLLSDATASAEAVLYFIDLDRFKSVNDTLGHAAGDIVLRLVADRLRTVADRCAAKSGQAPLIGRLAGDEFTMLLPKPRSRADAERIGRAILAALSAPIQLGEHELSIGASVGIAIRPEHGATLHDLMRAADAAMYHAKAQGRGRAEHFSDALAADIAERAQLESDLRSGVEKGEFALVFQPQISARDGRIVGAEALLRWRHADGLRMPAAFMQRAEETGLIVEIGEWVVQQVAETIARWGKSGVQQRLAVNISPRQIDHASFFRRLREAMHAARAPASLLELEITETLAMHCSQDVLDAIAMLRADGASIAIDDFGTGYSNLARLRELPLDRVKLDRSIVEHVAREPAARSIAQAVIGLIHGLGCEAVAEGIESEAQAAVLRVIGCDVLQGYAVAEPMAETLFLEWSRGVEPQRIAV